METVLLIFCLILDGIIGYIMVKILDGYDFSCREDPSDDGSFAKEDNINDSLSMDSGKYLSNDNRSIQNGAESSKP